MLQPAKADRKTIVIRIPRKYRSLIRAFCVWLKTHPDQASLWNCEEKLSQTLDQKKSQSEIASDYSSAMNWLQRNNRRAS